MDFVKEDRKRIAENGLMMCLMLGMEKRDCMLIIGRKDCIAEQEHVEQRQR